MGRLKAYRLKGGGIKPGTRGSARFPARRPGRGPGQGRWARLFSRCASTSVPYSRTSTQGRTLRFKVPWIRLAARPTTPRAPTPRGIRAQRGRAEDYLEHGDAELHQDGGGTRLRRRHSGAEARRRYPRISVQRSPSSPRMRRPGLPARLFQSRAVVALSPRVRVRGEGVSGGR